MVKRKRTQSPSLGDVEGAIPSVVMPGFLAPQLAILRPRPPTGAEWIHEIKLDGYRAQAHVSADGTKVFTRSGLNWTKRFVRIEAELAGAGLGQAIIDGEIVVVVDERTDFGALQADLATGRQDRMLFYAFDLLYADGYDLRKVPLVERKRLLRDLFDRFGLSAPIIYSEHMETDGAAMFEAAKRLNWEGIISKKADAPYRSGDRSDSWQKIKTSVREKFPIVGFIPGAGGISALYLGKREGRELRYIGKVGTGFTRTTAADLRRKLDAIATPKQKLTKQVRKPKATWVEPVLIADVEYRDITGDGLLRHPSFKGLADD